MTKAEIVAQANDARFFYEKGLEAHRRDVRLGLMPPDKPFHVLGEEQQLYIEEAVAAKAQGIEFETEDPHDARLHEPVRVEQPYVE